MALSWGAAIKEASDYFFSLPRFNFGGVYLAGFPNETLAQVFECLCDFRITACAINYALYTPLSSGNGIPLYYEVTDVVQTRAANSEILAELYSSDVLCDATPDRFISKGALTCSRRRLDDTTCERRRCKGYSLQLSGDTCSFSCIVFLFVSDYELKVTYENFGDVAEPVEDGVCPDESETTTVTPVSSTLLNSMNNSFSYSNNSAGDVEQTTQRTTETIFTDGAGGDSVDNKGFGEDSSDTPFLIPILAGACGFLILVVIGVSVYCRLARGQQKDINNTSAPDTSAASSEFKKTDFIGAETGGPIHEDPEREIYHTLDEMSGSTEQPLGADECDEQGYNVISDCDTKVRSPIDVFDEQGYNVISDYNSEERSPVGEFDDKGYLVISDCNTKELSLDKSRDRNEYRPLPHPPKPETTENLISSEGSSSSAGTDISSVKPPPYLSTLEDPTSPKDSVSSLPPPRPHVRLVNLENLKYMGLVKLRQDQTRFGQETEVKLIRTQQGNLELVNVQEELPAFVEYYNNLQLIKQTNGSIGVVGLLATDTESAGNDRSADQGRSNEVGENLTFDSQLVSPHDNASDRGGKSRLNEREEKSNPYLIYFGSVELDENVKVDHCDYLTVRDIDPRDLSVGSDGYLTASDLHKINGSVNSQDFLIKL